MLCAVFTTLSSSWLFVAIVEGQEVCSAHVVCVVVDVRDTELGVVDFDWNEEDSVVHI